VPQIMIGLLKSLVKPLALPALYISGIFLMYKTIFKEPKWGFFLLAFLIPQPNLWHKLFSYPFGKDFLDFLYVSIILGIILQKQGFSKSNNGIIITVFIVASYLSLWNSSLRFDLPLPLSLSSSLIYDWKNYAQMIFMYFLAFNVVDTKDEQEKIIFIISLAIFIICLRSYRNFGARSTFSYDARDAGPFWAVGLGANHYGAFLAHFSSFFIGIFFFVKKKWEKILYSLTALLAISALLFSYSRGAYLASLAAISFFGLRKKSLLVVVLILLLSWQFLLPPSVVDRISMTEDSSGRLENSASHRVVLWEHALDLFTQSPIVGVGFRGFGMNMPEGELKDTHNYYFLMLCEEGLIGLFLMLLMIWKAWHSGWVLFKISDNNFDKGLGFGFMGCVVACAISNMFGDRWSYFALGSYFWLLWGVVDKSILLANLDA